MSFRVAAGEALLPEETEFINKPGRSDEDRREVRKKIVRECIMEVKPLSKEASRANWHVLNNLHGRSCASLCCFGTTERQATQFDAHLTTTLEQRGARDIASPEGPGR